MERLSAYLAYGPRGSLLNFLVRVLIVLQDLLRGLRKSIMISYKWKREFPGTLLLGRSRSSMA